MPKIMYTHTTHNHTRTYVCRACKISRYAYNTLPMNEISGKVTYSMSIGFKAILFLSLTQHLSDSSYVFVIAKPEFFYHSENLCAFQFLFLFVAHLVGLINENILRKQLYKSFLIHIKSMALNTAIH